MESIKRKLSNWLLVKNLYLKPKVEKEVISQINGMNNDDTFLVSYPRSGSNLVRFIMSYIISAHKLNKTIQTFSEARNFIPNLHPDNVESIRNLNRPRFVKTHLQYSLKRIPKVVYVYRDGRDVYYSYYNWMQKKNLISYEISFSEFLITQIKTNNRWSTHINEWVFNYPQDKIFLIKYENLLVNKEDYIRKISEFINIPITKDEIKNLIDISSFENMSKSSNKNDVVLNKGKSGNWKSFYDEETKGIFKKFENKTLVKLGYENSSNW